MRFLIIAVAMLAAFLCLAYAQEDPADSSAAAIPDDFVPPLMEVVPIEATTYHPCAIMLPQDFNPSRAYPLVIGLHGYGGNAERFSSNFSAFADPQFIYVVPEAPYISPQPEWIGYSWILFDTGNLEMEFQIWHNSMEYVLEVNRFIREQFKVSDTYLMGFSQGGTLTYRLAMEAPEAFAGIACISAPMDEHYATEEALEEAQGLRVFIACGTEDLAFILENTRDSKDLLTEHGFDVQYVEFEGGHTFDAAILQQIENWILDREAQ